MTVQEFEGPHSWRLTRYDEETGVNDIVEFRIQGVITDKLLPPVNLR
jgi:hypothetical protein